MGNNKKELHEYYASYREEHREEIKENNKRYRERLKNNRPLQTWAATLNYCYGLSIKDYEDMNENQGGRCAICHRDTPSPRNSQRFFCIDHDHATGKIRGLLCYWCNTGIGLFQDCPETLHRAASYLEKEGFHAGLK